MTQAELSLQKKTNGIQHTFLKLVQSRSTAIFLAAVAVGSCLVTYLLLRQASVHLDTVYWLLNLDLVLLLLLGAVIAWQVVRLWGERKRGAAGGARLHTRLVLVFSFLTATPAILMAVFSSIFFYFGVNAWLDDRVSTAVNESLEVAQAYLKEHQQVMRADVLAMANDLNRMAPDLMDNQDEFSKFMDTQSMLRNLPEAIVIRSDGRVIAKSHLSSSLASDILPQKDIKEAREGEVVLMTGSGHDRIRALVKLDRFLDSYLYVGRLVDAAVLAHTQTAESAVKEYDSIQGRRMQLQISITAMFMAVTLLLLLGAIWFGLSFSRQLMNPISALIITTERVRRGDMAARIEAPGEDEFGMLGDAFNRMTDQIQSQQEALLRANSLLDERRRFTEAVLEGASSGVLGVDEEGKIFVSNNQAGLLLGKDSGTALVGTNLFDFLGELRPLFDDKTLASHAIQMEHAVADGPLKTLFVRMTRERGGHEVIVTVDDITALVSAQRKAAWSDVARRIAHEIKNPLTPIQLSAERLKRKYLPQIHEDPETFEKCTETIIRQVHDIGHMVSEFSAYARMPLPVKNSENIVDICQDALILQRQAHPDIGFGFIASQSEVVVNVDRSQITQVLTNLLQNAIDSIGERQQNRAGDGHIKVTVEDKQNNILIYIEDNGVGLPDKIKQQLLEPYVTTKKKGSGLGLAIVKKIMEDHGGSISLEDLTSYSSDQEIKTGAKAVMILPKEANG